MSNFSAISWQVTFWRDVNDDDIHFVLDQYTDLDFYNASSLKQQAVCRHVVQLAYIIRFRANQSLLLLLSAACLVENQFF
jgi:hypothetical protein